MNLKMYALLGGLIATGFHGKAINSNEYAFAKAEKTRTLSIEKKDPKSTFIRVAILLDTSNSMDGLIDQAKAQLWELVNELSYAKCGNDIRPELEIALYEYGNDRLNAQEGYVKQVLPFSNDLDEISKQLFALTTNGGNEYCGKVIQTSLNQLQWGQQDEDLNLIFIAGNEPFTQGPIRYQDAASNACEKDVTINTIFCGNYNEGVNTWWKDGADRTKGNYIAINHDRRTVHIASPYDDKILEKNNALNKTYVRYGRQGASKMALQAEQDSNAESYGAANAVKRAVSKSSHFYKNSSWDLVDAEEEESFSYDDLKESELPTELKGKSKKEIKDIISSKRKERERIQEEIAMLNKKRMEYVAQKSKAADNQLRNAMVEAIKKQAKSKNYTWE